MCSALIASSSEQWIELEVPPEAGNGPENAGLPLACLLWHLPAGPLVALVEALLLERRVLMVAQVLFSMRALRLSLLPRALRNIHLHEGRRVKQGGQFCSCTCLLHTLTDLPGDDTGA